MTFVSESIFIPLLLNQYRSWNKVVSKNWMSNIINETQSKMHDFWSTNLNLHYRATLNYSQGYLIVYELKTKNKPK